MDELFNLLPRKNQIHLLETILSFPNTEKSHHDERMEALKIIEVDDLTEMSYGTMYITNVHDDVNLIAAFARENLNGVINALRCGHAHFCLNKFHCIRIYEGDMLVLEIRNRARSNISTLGRCAVVNVSYFRRQLLIQARVYAEDRKEHLWTVGIITLTSLALAAVILQTWSFRSIWPFRSASSC